MSEEIENSWLGSLCRAITKQGTQIVHSRTVTSTLNARSFTVFIHKITLHSKRIHKLAKHAESYSSLQGGESLNSCPNTGCLHIHSEVHKLSCSSTTRCHHSAVHKSSLRLQSVCFFTCTGCGPALWKQSFLQGMETECARTDSEPLAKAKHGEDNHQASTFALDSGSGGLSRIFQKRNTWTF